MRKAKLELKSVIFITKEAHEKLKKLKKICKKSMAQIAVDLINEEYEKQKE